MPITEMEATARSYRELQDEIKKLEAETAWLKDQLIEEMDARQVEDLIAGEYTIHYSLMEMARFDTMRFKAEQPDLYGQYTRLATACRFQIT